MRSAILRYSETVLEILIKYRKVPNKIRIEVSRWYLQNPTTIEFLFKERVKGKSKSIHRFWLTDYALRNLDFFLRQKLLTSMFSYAMYKSLFKYSTHKLPPLYNTFHYRYTINGHFRLHQLRNNALEYIKYRVIYWTVLLQQSIRA